MAGYRLQVTGYGWQVAGCGLEGVDTRYSIRNRRREKGFTLIELMIALIILSAMFVIIIQALKLVKKGEARAEDQARVYQMGRVAIDRLKNDLAMAFLVTDSKLLGATPGGVKKKTAFIGKSSIGEDSLSFNTFSHLRMYFNAKESDQAEVGYYVENSPSGDGSKVLMRRESPYIDDDVEEGGKAYVLAEGVTKFKLSYYDGKKFEWFDEWNTESAANKDQLPRAVKITISFKHPYFNDREITFVDIAFIEMWRSPIDF